MLRQYELVEKVKAFNPNANENLINKAYVYAMKAHGHQRARLWQFKKFGFARRN